MRIRLLPAVLLGLVGIVPTGPPAHADPGPDAYLVTGDGGGPATYVSLVFNYPKPNTSNLCLADKVSFYWDGQLFATVTPSEAGGLVRCQANDHQPPPVSDRAPGDHTVRATTTAAGVPTLTATYTITGSAAAGGTSTKTPTPTRTAPTRTPASAPTTAPVPADGASSASDGAPGSATAPGSTQPAAVLAADPPPGTGPSGLAWFLIVAGGVLLVGVGSALAVVFRRPTGSGP
jgi:hypothetical protein